MSEETKNVETGKNATEEVQEVKPAELADADLDKVAGGKSYFESRSNIASVEPAPLPKAGGHNPI